MRFLYYIIYGIFYKVTYLMKILSDIMNKEVKKNTASMNMLHGLAGELGFSENVCIYV